jgi:dihydroxy-acid dehydratase
VLSAIGGSTNAVIHLTAMARRLGVELTLTDFDEAGRGVPVIVDIEPSGAGLMEDFDAAGATPSVWRALGEVLDLDAQSADGQSLALHAESAPAPATFIRSLEDPIDAAGALRVVYGNLAPDGAVIKRCAATESLLRHRGPAIVLRSAAQAEAFALSNEEIDPRSVIVLAGAGPIGGPGMPEWGMVSLPASVVASGVHDMVRVTDARMSGTSFGTVFLHVAPEAAVGGPLALVRTGDVIAADADGGTLTLEVDETELSRRRNEMPEIAAPTRGYISFYNAHVMQAPEGCDFDFLATAPGESPRLIEPVVGRS